MTGPGGSGKSAGTPPGQDPAGGVSGERLAKVIARAGLCSRRDAEHWIRAGRVKVNDQLVLTPAITVDSADQVAVDGVVLTAPSAPRLWRYHKPAGLLTTHRDPQGRPTVFSTLPPELGRVIAVGRLDLMSEGLLLLTNDGALSRHLELPATGWTRRYRVRAFGRLEAEQLATLRDGVTIDGIAYGPVEGQIDRVQGGNVWLTLSLREGKNREVRNLLAHLGLQVNRLIRIAYGPFQLGRLPRGQLAEVPKRVLRDQLGAAWRP